MELRDVFSILFMRYSIEYFDYLFETCGWCAMYELTFLSTEGLTNDTRVLKVLFAVPCVGIDW